MHFGGACACHYSACGSVAMRRLASRAQATGGASSFPEFLKNGAKLTQAAHEAWDQV